MAFAMTHPDVRAIVCARGGYGATRIVERLPWDEFRRSPKWIVGYSDVTALHVECTRLGIASMHGDNAGTMGSAAPGARLAWMNALEHGRMQSMPAPVVHAEGEVRGTLVGGNLSLLLAQAAEGRLAWPDDAIVAIEDIGERPYRVDRMLQALLPRLQRSRGVLFGSFTDCLPNSDGVSVDDVIADFASRAQIPVYAGAPFGHGEHNRPLVFGSKVELGRQGLRVL